MAVDDFIKTESLCHQHKQWRKYNPTCPDYLSGFCDAFAKYKKEPHRSRPSQSACIVTWINLGINIPNGVKGFCDITNYLNYIKTHSERLTCYFGLHWFMIFGGVVRIGVNDYTSNNDDGFLDEIYNKTKHII